MTRVLTVQEYGAIDCLLWMSSVTIECSLAPVPERYTMGVVATDQDTGDVITVCFTLAGSSDDFIVYLK